MAARRWPTMTAGIVRGVGATAVAAGLLLASFAPALADDTTPPVLNSATLAVSGTGLATTGPTIWAKPNTAYTSASVFTVTFQTTDEAGGSGLAAHACPTAPTGFSLASCTMSPDQLGNGASTMSRAVLINTSPPPAPTRLALSAASDTGISATDGITSVAVGLVVTGSAEAGSTVTLYDVATAIGSGLANGSGAFSIATSVPLADGAHALSATTTDQTGLVSPASATLPLTIDTTAPTAPVAPRLAASSDTGVSASDGVTSNSTGLVFVGSAEPGSTIWLYDGATPLASSAADTAGAWAITVATTLAEGSHSISVTSTDVAGNVSPSSASTQIVIDLSAPTVLITALPTAVGSRTIALPYAASDAVSGVAAIDLYAANSASTPIAGYTHVSTSSASPATFTVPSDGPWFFYAVATDTAGNRSTAPAGSDASTLVDTVAPTASISISGGMTDTQTSAVSLTLGGNDSTGSGVTTMRLSNDAQTGWGPWIAFAASESWTLTAGGDGPRTVSLEVRDAAGNVSDPATVSMTLDTTAPTATVALAGGTTATRTTSVVLALTADDFGGTGATWMRFSNDGSSWSAWQSFAATASWTIDPGSDGTRTVSAEVQDGVGNVSAPASATFILDTVAPLISELSPSADAITSLTRVDVAWAETEAGSGIASRAIQLQVAPITAPGVCGTTWTDTGVPVNTSIAATTISGLPANECSRVAVTLTDAAGNTSAPAVTGSLLVDDVGPIGTVSINAGAAWTNDPGVTLTLAATDVGSGVAEMRLSNDGATWSAWEPYVTSRAWTLASGSDGSRTVSVEYRDRTGNGGSATSEAIGLDRTAPSVALSIDGGALVTRSTSLALSIAAADALSGLDTFSTSLDGGVTWSAPAPFDATATLDAPGMDGIRTVDIRVADRAGNVRAARASITIDTTPPATPDKPRLDPASDTGALSNDDLTQLTTVTILGSAEAGSTVHVHDGKGSLLATTSAGSDGAWRAAVTLPPNAVSTICVTAADAAGNTSASSDALAVNVDTTDPVSSVGSMPVTTQGPVLVPFSASDANGIDSVVLYAAQSPSGPWTSIGSVLRSPFVWDAPSLGRWYFASQATDLAGNVEGALRADASTTVYPAIGPDAQSNLWTFADGELHFGAASGGSIGLGIDTDASSGDNSIARLVSGAGVAVATSSLVPAAEGRTFTVSGAWAVLEGTSASLSVCFLDANLATVSCTPVGSVGPLGESDLPMAYASFSTTTTVPTGASWADIRLSTDGSVGLDTARLTLGSWMTGSEIAIELDAPAVVDFGSGIPGDELTVANAPVTVTTNDPYGYNLTVEADPLTMTGGADQIDVSNLLVRVGTAAYQAFVDASHALTLATARDATPAQGATYGLDARLELPFVGAGAYRGGLRFVATAR